MSVAHAVRASVWESYDIAFPNVHRSSPSTSTQ